MSIEHLGTTKKKKRGGGGGLAMRKGVTKSVEVVLTREHEILAIMREGGGGAKSFGPASFRLSHFVAPLPVITDQSLTTSN